MSGTAFIIKRFVRRLSAVFNPNSGFFARIEDRGMRNHSGLNTDLSYWISLSPIGATGAVPFAIENPTNRELTCLFRITRRLCVKPKRCMSFKPGWRRQPRSAPAVLGDPAVDEGEIRIPSQLYNEWSRVDLCCSCFNGEVLRRGQ